MEFAPSTVYPPRGMRRFGTAAAGILVALLLGPITLLGRDAVLLAITALLALALAAWAAWRPVRALVVLVVALGLQLPVAALALRLGAPIVAVRGLGAVKEVLVLGVLVAGAAAFLVRQPRADAIDRSAVAYIALVAAYLVVGLVGPRIGIDLLARAPDSVTLQGVAFRSLVVGVALLLAVRGLRPDHSSLHLLAGTIVVVGVLIALAAMVEWFAPTLWERFAQRWLGYADYQRRIFSIHLDTIVVRSEVGSRLLVRSGSLLFDYLQVGFFLLPALLLAIARAVRATSLRAWMLVALLAAGILLTLTRSAVLAALVAVVALVLAGGGTARRRVGRVATAAAVVVVGAAIVTGTAARFLSVTDGADASTSSRLTSVRVAATQLAATPWGLGLATTAETAPRAQGPGVVAENAYLDLGVQVGVGGVAIFVVLLLFIVGRLWARRADRPLAPIGFAILAGLSVGGLFLHTWMMLETTWIAFALVGLAIPRPDG